MSWTPKYDSILLEHDMKWTAASRAIRRASRGRFVPDPTTCARRAEKLLLERMHERMTKPVSPRGDTPSTPSSIPPRVRAPLAERVAPPPVLVLVVPPGVEGDDERTLSTMLGALTPGWSWSVAPEYHDDALSCARHRASLRAEPIVVFERDPDGAYHVAIGSSPVYSLVGKLVPVRFTREVHS